MARSGAPSIVTGACPSVSVIRAPISARGLRTRSIGRREREASPISVKVPSCGASSPEIIRIVDPELPQSSGSPRGVTRPPTPVTSTRPSSSLRTLAPSASMQRSVEAQSAPVEKFEKREVPSANAASIP